MVEKEVKKSLLGAKVFVGLSGGVDSAVTAALLKHAGAQVTGVFIKGWYPPGMPCTWADDRRDAMRVAAHLGLPFRTLDASVEYKAAVIDYLLGEYRAGRTPNPDIMCNREVKFGAFYRYAMTEGADYIATGHYAQSKDGTLSQGVDASKDQSYFLWAVPKEVLEKTLFPLGSRTKETVRHEAEKLHLPNAAKRDSQGICFLGSISVEDFLRKEIGAAPGAAINEKGEVVGNHEGAVLYTLGTRIALTDAPPGPWYVMAKDMEKNVLTVTHKRTTLQTSNTIGLTETNWIAPELLAGAGLAAQYRYHGPLVSGSYNVTTATYTPRLKIQEPVAAGQSLVLYRGNQCVGGGIIA